MADVNTTDHLVRPEKDTLVNGYDNESFHSYNRGVEDGEEFASDEERLRGVATVTENGHGPHDTTDPPQLPNGHEANGRPVNGTAVVLADEDGVGMDHKSQQKPLDTRLHTYVPAEDVMDRKILNGSDGGGGTHVSIPEDAVISFSSGRVRVKKGAPSGGSPQSARDRESIPLETMPPSYEGGCGKATGGLSGEKAELEAELSNHKNGVWSAEGHTNYGSAESHFISEKLNGTSKSSDEVSLPVNNHRKCLRGEKLYLTEESRKLCPGWRRLLICGLILIMIAVALLLGVLAATGILLSKSDSKNTRYESGHSLPNMDSIAHAGHSFRPKPSSKVPQKFQPPVTAEAEHLPNATPSTATFDVHDTVSQAPPSTVTFKVPPLLQNDSSHSQTIVPNALVGEFKIIDENFTDDLNDNSSRGYLNLARNLETELHRIFKDNEGRFDELKVLNFRPGSIRVKFVVIWSSDQGIISSERAAEILSADLRAKNNSFYNFFYVDMSSIHFISVFDECRIQKGGCTFDCVWNYDTLLKTCICPNDAYLLSDGKSCNPKPETSSTSLFTTSTTSLQNQPSSQSMPTFEPTEPTAETVAPQENQPTLYPFSDAPVTTTPKYTNTEYYPTSESPATETFFKDNLDTKHDMTTTEVPPIYPQTFPVEVTTQSPPKEETSEEKVYTFPETSTVTETTLPSQDGTIGRPPSAFTTESATTAEGITAQTSPYYPGDYTGNTETIPTEARETGYPNYDTTLKYYPSTYTANTGTEAPIQDHTEYAPTTKGSTLRYHIPEPTTEIYTWSPHHDYPTESFNPETQPDTAHTNPQQETTFPVTYREGIVDESETTTPKVMTESVVTPNINREGTWQENQTLPTTFDGNVWKEPTEYTTVRDMTDYETTNFPHEGRMFENTTSEVTTMEEDSTATTNPYVHSSFPLFMPYFNRTPGVRSYDNFTDYYDNSTYVDHKDFGTDTTGSEVPIETSSSMGTFPLFIPIDSSNETSYEPETESTYSGFADTTMGNLKPFNFSEESTFVNYGSEGFTTPQYNSFGVTETVGTEVTDETPNPTYFFESNTTFPFKAVTDSHSTETSPYNYGGMNWTNSENYNPLADINTEPVQYNFTTPRRDDTETMHGTYNTTFQTESTGQFPSKAVTEIYYPKEDTTMHSDNRTYWPATEGQSFPLGYNTETVQDNITTYPARNDETETTLQPETTTIVGPEMDTTQFATGPVYTQPLFSYTPSNVTYEAEATTIADFDTAFTMQEGNGTTIDQDETITYSLMNENTTRTAFASEFQTSPATVYPQKSGKSETESTPFQGWSETSPNTEITTAHPDNTPQRGTNGETVYTQMDTATDATTMAVDTTEVPTLLPIGSLDTDDNRTTVVTVSPIASSSHNTESDLTKVIPFDTTMPTTHRAGEADYTTIAFEETMPTTYSSGDQTFAETDGTTLTPPETDQPMSRGSENSNDTRSVTEPSPMSTSRVMGTGSDMTTPSYTEFQSFSNTYNTTLLISETSNNSTFSYENSDSTTFYPDTTSVTMKFSNDSEEASSLGGNNSTLMHFTTPLSNYDGNSTDITGFPYDMDAATTLAPYAYENATMVLDGELNSNLTGYMNRSDGNSTDEFGGFYPDGFNSTDGNYTGFDESANMTTTAGYDMLNETTTNVSIGIVCTDDQFICEPLNICLNRTFMCDGIQDCPDGVDESNCQPKCDPNFLCSNSTNKCIMKQAQCDGIWDCENGTDEENCKPSECDKHEVMCSDHSKCIRPSDICDLKYDCKDRSDEVGCVERTTCESGGKFFCNDGLCIPWSLKCDGEFDCKDKEDEGNCTCYSDEFQCNDGKCLKSSSRCDGHRDCHDGDDEMGCVNVDAQHLVMTYEPYSGTWAMLCAEDWSLDDGHYLCQELGFGHALKTEKLHVSFNGTWMAMRRENLTDASLWTERVSFVESCTSSLAASVECQKFACGEYTGLLHRRKRELPSSRRNRELSSPRWKREVPGSSSSSSSQWPFVGYTSTFYSTKGCLSEILTPIWLITSADCLLSISKQPFNGSDWYVRTNIGRNVEAGSVQNHEVLRIISHPHSSKFRSLIVRDYDVALIRLKHALVFVSDKIGAICPPEEQVPPGITCFSGVLGMQTPRAPPPVSLAINSLALQIIDRKNCNSVDQYNNMINQRMMCTQSSEGHTICDNDEGTPLMCLSGINKWFLAGMLTYQRYCEVYNKHPAVFSNLFSMRKFVDQVTGQKQYEIPYDSNIYLIIPPTTPSPTIPETTTVMYTTTESMETTVTDFSTAVSGFATVNGTVPYEDTTLDFSTTPMESGYEDTTLPSEEFIEGLRSEGNYTTLEDGNATETTVGYPESTYTLRGTYIIADAETRDQNSTGGNVTATLDFTTVPYLGETVTDTTIPVTLESEMGLGADNSSDLEPKMFEGAFNASGKTHDSMMAAQPNETYAVNTYIPYLLTGNRTEYATNTTSDVTTVAQPEVSGTLSTTEYATDYDVFNSSAVSLTRMPVMSMANETLDSVIEPERFTLTTVTEYVGPFPTERTAAGDWEVTSPYITGNATASSVDLTATENSDGMKETTLTAAPVNDSGTVTEEPLHRDASTIGLEWRETETVAHTMEDTASYMKETVTEPVFKMEGRAETFQLQKAATTPTDFNLKVTAPIDFTMNETILTDFNSTDITPEFSLKETGPTNFNAEESVPVDSNLKETTSSYNLSETTTESSPRSDLTKSYMMKETTTTDLGLKETETPYRMEETTIPTYEWKDETETEPVTETDGITDNPHFESETTTPAPVQHTTPSTETRTLMYETEVGTDGDIAIFAFNDSDGIVVKPAESPDGLSLVDTNGSSTAYNMSRSRKLDEPPLPSDIRYDSMRPNTEYATTPMVPAGSDSVTTPMVKVGPDTVATPMVPVGPDTTASPIVPVGPDSFTRPRVTVGSDSFTTTRVPVVSDTATSPIVPVGSDLVTTPRVGSDSVTTEWEEYYITLTTPKSVDEMEDLTTTTETAGKDISVTTTPSYQLLNTSAETTATNPESAPNLTETKPPFEDYTTLFPGAFLMEYSNSSTNATVKETFLNGECGTWDRPLTDQNNTKFYKEWPALGYLQLISEKKMCAASLVSENFVLTSLNCLSVRDNQLNPDKWAYVGGLYNVDPSIEGQQNQLVAEIIPFDNNSTSLLFHENNLALVRIKHRVEFNNYSKSACLPTEDIQPNQQCYTTGWSQVPAGKEEGKRFYSVPVNIIPQNECNSTSTYNGLLLDSLICASYNSESFPTCQMDLGSPLFCLNNGLWDLQGVLNFPNPCDMVQPAVYNSVYKIQDWIRDILLDFADKS